MELQFSEQGATSEVPAPEVVNQLLSEAENAPSHDGVQDKETPLKTDEMLTEEMQDYTVNDGRSGSSLRNFAVVMRTGSEQQRGSSRESEHAKSSPTEEKHETIRTGDGKMRSDVAVKCVSVDRVVRSDKDDRTEDIDGDNTLNGKKDDVGRRAQRGKHVTFENTTEVSGVAQVSSKWEGGGIRRERYG